MHNKLNVPKPSKEHLQSYLTEWDKLDNYREQESAIDDLFNNVYKDNISLKNILIKCSVLNDFYSTNIFKIYDVAKHIFGITDLDVRLTKGDLSLVDEIANIDLEVIDTTGNIKLVHKRFYSFATKYCSHHNNKSFPIYDSYVHKILCYINTHVEKFSNFKSPELKDCETYTEVLRSFNSHFNLNTDFKTLDKYLWQLGKKTFSNK